MSLKACDSVNAARADIAEYIGWYNAGRAHSSLAEVTPDEQCFAQLPTLMAMAAQDEVSGAPRLAHRVGRIVASADRRRGQLCTVCNPPAANLKVGDCCLDKRGHFCRGRAQPVYGAGG